MGRENRKNKELRKLLAPLARFWKHDGKRYCAVALCASLIAGNLGHLAVAASEEPDYEFELSRQELSDALQEAVANGEPVSDDFGFEGVDADLYTLSMPIDETLYELTPEIADNEGDLQLRIFVHLENSELINDLELDTEIVESEESISSDEEESTGTEQLFFLLTNHSDKAQTAVIRVGNRESEWIVVEPYSMVEMPEPEGEAGGPGVVGPGEAAGNEENAGEQNADGSSSEVIVSGGSDSVSGGGPGSGGSSGGSSSGGSSSGGGSSEPTEGETITESESTPSEEESTPGVEGTEPDIVEPETEADGTETPETDESKADEPVVDEPVVEKPEDDAAGTDGSENGNVAEGNQEDGAAEGDEPANNDSSTNEPDGNNAEDHESSDHEDENADSDSDNGASETDTQEDGDTTDSQSDEVTDTDEASSDTDHEADNTNDASGADDMDTAGDDDQSSDDTGSEEELTAAVSIHKTYRVASSKATPSNATLSDEEYSNATPSDATPSDAAKESLDGMIYDAVRMGDGSAVAFVTTLNDVGITLDGHFTECEEDCSGKDCTCGCHEVAHQFLKQLDDMLAEAKTYTEETSVDTFWTMYDKLMGYEPGFLSYEVEAAYDRGELTDSEIVYVNEVYAEKGFEILGIMQGFGFDPYAVGTMALSTVEADKAKNVNVNVFNYDNTVNTRTDGLGPEGYSFFQGDYVKDDGTDTKEGSVDGVYNGDPDIYNKNNHPIMSKMLVNDYPYVESKASGTVDIEGSMKYLFDVDGDYHKGTMTDGGGLFKWDGDGYYYDSAENAARFNGTNFTLYEEIIRPKYQALAGSDVTNGNFLPFNNPDNSIQLNDANGDPEKSPNGEDAYQLTENTDLWFGMTVDFPFLMPKDGLVVNDSGESTKMEFDFHGDDDVFVYIDDVLVLDIGGTHAALTGTIDFSTGTVIDPTGETTLKALFDSAGKDGIEFEGNTFDDYSQHTLKFYYMERGGNISYCRLKFNMPTIPENSLTVTKEVDSENENDITKYLKDTLEYKFKVIQADENGQPLTGKPLFIGANEEFDILENNKKVDTGTVGTDGYFTLKSGQSAQFTGMTERGRTLKCYNYIVLEELPEDAAGQYGSVEYKVTEQGGSSAVEGEESEPETFNTIQTGKLSAEKSQYVVYKNKVDTSMLSALKITKEKTQGTIFDTDQKFDIRVKLGEELLPVGTKYQVNDESSPRTVSKEGEIQLGVDETATLLTGIIAGTEYEISEVIPDGAVFDATYSGEITSSDSAKGTVVTTDSSKVTGSFTPGDTIHITVTNSDYDIPAVINLSKTTTGFAEDAAHTFDFKVEACDENGVLFGSGNYEGTSISTVGDETKTGTITIGYQSTGDDGTHYYKITENDPGDDGSTVIYDKTAYIVEIKVDSGTAAVSSVYELTPSGEKLKDDDQVLDFTNVESTKAVIRKTVKGNMGDRNKPFTFHVTLSDPNETLKKAIYAFEGSNETTLSLKHGESIELKNLPVGAMITVTEDNGDYVTSYIITGSETENEGASASAELNRETIEFSFVNVKNETVDTGILLDSMPYVLILAAVAAGMAFYFVRKKKEDEDDFE